MGLKKLLYLPAKVWLEGCISKGLTTPTSGPCSKMKRNGDLLSKKCRNSHNNYSFIMHKITYIMCSLIIVMLLLISFNM